MCVGGFGQVMGCGWESGSDLKGKRKGKNGAFTLFHLLLSTLAVSLLPGSVILGERPET